MGQKPKIPYGDGANRDETHHGIGGGSSNIGAGSGDIGGGSRDDEPFGGKSIPGGNTRRLHAQ